MKKLYLSVLAMYIGILSSFSQNTSQDSAAYKSRKLKLDEINFVSGYYRQNGDNSAVTGGIGTEKLSDFANEIELKFSRYDRRLRKHSLGFELGIDHYTSASSDKIDPLTISSASVSDTRIYPSFVWSIQNEQKGTTLGFNASFSNEFDYRSFGLGGYFTKASKDHNREFIAKLQAYLDQWSVIYPVELRGILGGTQANGIAGHSPRKSYSASLTYSQVISQRLQVLLTTEPTYQNGLLATKYQRVYFINGSEKAETLPDQRLKIPIGIRANYFIGDRFIIRSFYRYYQDNWGLKAHTLELETAIKITPYFSISPFYRFYAQNKVDYFSPYAGHSPSERYFTSDYDLSKFTSNNIGTGFRIIPAKGVFGVQKWSSLELRYGHYLRSNGLFADQLSLHFQFK
jgi:hypothetical protein